MLLISQSNESQCLSYHVTRTTTLLPSVFGNYGEFMQKQCFTCFIQITFRFEPPFSIISCSIRIRSLNYWSSFETIHELVQIWSSWKDWKCWLAWSQIMGQNRWYSEEQNLENMGGPYTFLFQKYPGMSWPPLENWVKLFHAEKSLYRASGCIEAVCHSMLGSNAWTLLDKQRPDCVSLSLKAYDILCRAGFIKCRIRSWRHDYSVWSVFWEDSRVFTWLFALRALEKDPFRVPS